MSNSIDMIVPMLREMRSEMRDRFDGTDRRLDTIDARISKLEDAQKNFKQALVSDTLLTRLVTGDFEERLEALKSRMAAFEGPKA